MWQLYKATGEEIYRENAEETEEKLDAALNNYWVMDHDSGFRWLPTSVAKYRLTGDKKSENRALMAHLTWQDALIRQETLLLHGMEMLIREEMDGQ